MTLPFASFSTPDAADVAAAELRTLGVTATRADSTTLQVGAADLDEFQRIVSAHGGRLTASHEVVPVIEEELQVSTRMVPGAQVRVVSRLLDEPTEQDVIVYQERVSIERRVVDRPAGPEDFALFEEGELIFEETDEEVVVEKVARVVEEVVVRSVVSERTETVRAHLRRTEVEVNEEARS